MQRITLATEKNALNYGKFCRNLSPPWRYHWQKKMLVMTMCISGYRSLPTEAVHALASTDSISLYDEIIVKTTNSFLLCIQSESGYKKWGIDRTFCPYTWEFNTRGCQIPTIPLLQPKWGMVVYSIDRYLQVPYQQVQ